jgi:cytochrome c
MHRTPRVTLALALAASIGSTARGATEEFGTAKQAENMVVKAIAHIKHVGAEQAYREFTDRAAGFADRDLYVVVYQLDGRVLAHGQYPKLVGQELLNLRDPNGKAWIRERVELARTKAKFWHDYKFADPITKKAVNKSAYCERLESTVVCVGVYKR